MKNKGFTLVELLLYIGLIGMFVSGAILFTWDVIYARERTAQKEVIDQNIRASMARIGYEIRQAKTISSLSANTLELENNDGTVTTLSLSSERVLISPQGTGPYELTSNLVRVTELSFTEFVSSNQNSKSVRVSITIEPANLLPKQNSISSTATNTIEFNSQFNLARQVLIDLSGATFTGSNRLTNAKIRNTGNSDVIIDKLSIAWTNPSASQFLTEVQIAGGDIEWTGSVQSGQIIDIIDYLLPAFSSQTPVNHLQFNSNMSGKTLYVTFVLTDGSSTTGLIVIGTQTGGTLTCQTYCQSLSYSNGTCRRSARVCQNNGEVYQSGGDQYCTVGVDDTCCCAP